MMQKITSDQDRFFHNIRHEKRNCWVWQRAKDKDGYGLFKIGSRKDKSRKMVRVHRWAYEQFIGTIPANLQIDHLCRNRSCVNPNHLDAVTTLENTRRGWRATKTKCKHGHPLFGDNLYIFPDGRRGCKLCRYQRAIAFQKKRRRPK